MPCVESVEHQDQIFSEKMQKQLIENQEKILFIQVPLSSGIQAHTSPPVQEEQHLDDYEEEHEESWWQAVVEYDDEDEEEYEDIEEGPEEEEEDDEEEEECFEMLPDEPGRLPELGQATCVVCQEFAAVATFVHGSTGHTACCVRCAREVQQRGASCPMCRRRFGAVIRNFNA